MDYSCSNYELACNECGKRYGNRPLSACPDCLAPLEVVYDLLNAKGVFTRDSIARGPASIWRYARMLPVPEGFQPDLPVGFTPLVHATRLGARIGAGSLYVKNDAVCSRRSASRTASLPLRSPTRASSVSTPSAARPRAISRTLSLRRPRALA
jgi:hypothetical protein